MSKTQAIVTKQSGPLAEMPKRLQNREPSSHREGFENTEQSDIKLPRLSLCQDTSDEGKERDGKYIKGLKPGQFFNTLTKEIYGTELHILPVYLFKTRVMYNSKVMGSGVRCKSSDFLHGEGDPGIECKMCKFSTWGDEWKDKDNPKGKPPCSESWNFPVLIVRNGSVDPSDFCISPFKSIGIDTAARTLITLGTMRKGNPSIYDCTYRLFSRLDKRDSGDSFQPIIENPSEISGWASDEMAEIGKACHDMIKEVQLSGRLHDPDSAKESNAEEV